MSPNELNEVLEQTVRRLSEADSMYGLFYEEMADGTPLPSAPVLAEIVDLCRAVLFPGFYGKSTLSSKTISYHIGVSMDRLCHLLTQQVLAGLKTPSNSPLKGENTRKCSEEEVSPLRGNCPLEAEQLGSVGDGDPKGLEEALRLCFT